jgi:lysyl-tRNA synthetase class 2
VPWQGETLEFGRPFERIAARDADGVRLVRPTYVVDPPAAEAPLARRNDGAPQLAEQFQLFVGGQPVAEGRSELNDADEVAARYDADFARAVEYGLPPASGVKLSVDRLVMVLTGSAALRDVVLFPAHAAR